MERKLWERLCVSYLSYTLHHITLLTPKSSPSPATFPPPSTDLDDRPDAGDPPPAPAPAPPPSAPPPRQDPSTPSLSAPSPLTVNEDPPSSSSLSLFSRRGGQGWVGGGRGWGRWWRGRGWVADVGVVADGGKLTDEGKDLGIIFSNNDSICIVPDSGNWSD
ncbi:hypothetical protein TIFTF001_012259 [Ficus carica]|uniref:Uncharacterized protein n=1 Tax=Ficus carica TaxID=3494 RepID=A0AA88D534_FICCA|nr:hypothetical protein TIFTF001_012259 [Ficus carica]